MKQLFLIICLFVAFTANAQTFGSVKASGSNVLDTISLGSFYEDLCSIAPQSAYRLVGTELLVKDADKIYTFYQKDKFERKFYGGKMVYRCIRNGVQIFVRKDFLIVSEK